MSVICVSVVTDNKQTNNNNQHKHIRDQVLNFNWLNDYATFRSRDLNRVRLYPMLFMFCLCIVLKANGLI